MDAVRQAAKQLASDLEHLQRAIVAELKGKREHNLYQQTDLALGQVVLFEKMIEKDATRSSLFQRFELVDRMIHEVLKRAQKSSELQRAAGLVEGSDDQIHYLLADRTSADQRMTVVRRQARALKNATASLEETAVFSLSGASDGAVLLGDIRKLNKAVQRFEAASPERQDAESQRKLMAEVNSAWEKVVAGLGDIPPRENIYLLREAFRVDSLHERLFELFSCPGKRPSLAVRV